MQGWRIHHFTHYSNDWLLLFSECFAFYWCNSSTTLQQTDFFFTVQDRGLLPSLCFTYSSLTERSSLLAALPFLAEVRCPPHLAPTSKQWVTLAGGPRSAAPQMPSRAQQLPEGVRAELHPESATWPLSGVAIRCFKQGIICPFWC